MRIDRLTIRNFNGFDFREFRFDPHFNLIVGDNASGKTTVLDALSIAIGSWFLGIPDYAWAVGIGQKEVRVVSYPFHDRLTFEKQFPARVEAQGQVLGKELIWAREMGREGGRTTTSGAKALSEVARDAERAVRAGKDITLPLLCSFGTERLWVETPHREKAKKEGSAQPLPSRLDGYKDCIDFAIQETSLLDWIRAEQSTSEQLREDTLALKLIRQAVIQCVEEASHLYYDPRYNDLVVKLSDYQLFRNLSDGQRIVLTLVGDLARRATTLNPHLGEKALEETPGVVLVDELDLHLHPKWQRRIIHDLKRTFPSIQFIATTHSPQLIGEAAPHEIYVLDENRVIQPRRSFGLDSNSVLEEVMHASPRNSDIGETLSNLATLIDREEFNEARKVIAGLESKLSPDDPELARARSLMSFLETTP